MLEHLVKEVRKKKGKKKKKKKKERKKTVYPDVRLVTSTIMAFLYRVSVISTLNGSKRTINANKQKKKSARDPLMSYIYIYNPAIQYDKVKIELR